MGAGWVQEQEAEEVVGSCALRKSTAGNGTRVPAPVSPGDAKTRASGVCSLLTSTWLGSFLATGSGVVRDLYRFPVRSVGARSAPRDTVWPCKTLFCGVRARHCTHCSRCYSSRKLEPPSEGKIRRNSYWQRTPPPRAWSRGVEKTRMAGRRILAARFHN